MERPEKTQGGGFAGGVYTGPSAQSPSNLGALAEALGVTGRAVTGALVDDFEKAIDTRKKTALDEAAVFEQTTAGYTSEQLRAEIEAEPMAARFKANPYLLPAINVYRGRKQADDLALQMAEAGVDTGDADAVQEFYRTNAPQLNDPFFARGFNEQNSRLQAQFSQQQLKDALSAAEEDRIAGAGTVFWEAFQASGDINAATEAVKGSVFGSSLDGKELSALQYNYAKRLANEGNIEAVDAMVRTKRGDAPALIDDVNYADAASVLVEEARRVRTQQTEGGRNAAQVALNERIRAGTSRAELLRSPEFASLARPGQKEGELSQEQKEVLNLHGTLSDQKAAEARQRNFLIEQESLLERANQRAAELLLGGQAFNISDFNYQTADGKSRKLTRSSLLNGAIEAARTAVLGEDPFNLTGQDATKYRLYTEALAKGGQVDPRLQEALSGMASMLTPEALKEDPASVEQAFTIYSNIDPVLAKKYVPDTTQRSILENMKNMISANPRMPVSVAASRAVAASVNPVKPKVDTKALNEALKKVSLTDYGDFKSGFLGIGSGYEKATADAAQIKDYVYEEASTLAANGMAPEAALKSASEMAKKNFVLVNGTAVRLPENPTGQLAQKGAATPEEFSQIAYGSIKAVADKRGGKPEDYRLQWMSGNAYVMSSVDGSWTDIVSAAELLAASSFAPSETDDPKAKTVAEVVSTASGNVVKNDEKRRAAEAQAQQGFMGP